MLRDAMLDVIGRIAPGDISLTVVSLTSGAQVTIDTVLRQEEDYIVIRGREGGTTDEARLFFIPYDLVAYLKIDRMAKANDVRRMWGEAEIMDSSDRMAAEAAADALGGSQAEQAKAKAAGTGSNPGTVPLPKGLPSAVPAAQAPGMDPASIAKQNLLDRIKAARTSAGGPPRPGAK